MAGPTPNESNIKQHGYHGGANQRWRLIEVEGYESTPQFKIESVHKGQVLDVWGDQDEDGSLIKLHDWHGGANQRWRLIEAYPNDEPRDEFLIQSVRSTNGTVLDVWGGEGQHGDGVDVRLYHTPKTTPPELPTSGGASP